MSIWSRIFAEKRTLIVALMLGIIGNIAAYALWVYPLGVKSEGAADRATAAARSLQLAERDMAAARRRCPASAPPADEGPRHALRPAMPVSPAGCRCASSATLATH
jgi:hypothetical protein